MIFEIDNVELYFKGKQILNGIYLKAESGKVTGILGRNGCGKSSLLDIAFGNLKPKYKLVRIDGQAIKKPLYINMAMYLPQYDFAPKTFKLKNLFETLNVDWNDFSLRYAQFAKYKVEKLKYLSGGERRFVETYLVLKAKNKIVFLDEPFNGISPIFVEEVKNLIKEEKLSKIIILTDHKYKDVIDVTDNLYLLNNGATKLIKKLTELEDYGYVNRI